MDLAIYPPSTFPDAFTPELPLSKSMSNRAMILDAISGIKPGQREVAKCDDTDAMAAALSDSRATYVNIGAAGTTMRFLTAYYASQPHTDITLDGTERMRKRPVAELVNALRQCGADIEFIGHEGFPPVAIHGHTLTGGEVVIDPSISSQFISALLMIAPAMTHGITLHLNGHSVSTPYIHMTIEMMRRRGITVEISRHNNDNVTIHVRHGNYLTDDTPIEPDWSAASYWYEFQALTGCHINIQSSPSTSLQGDAIVAQMTDLLNSGQTPLKINFHSQPDLAQTFMVTASLMKIPFEFSGLTTLHIKETDRIHAMRTELKKLGVHITEPKNGTVIWDGIIKKPLDSPVIDTYNDHRMAMSMAFASIHFPGLTIRDSDVVSKSYPRFWDNMQRAGFKLTPIN